MTQVINPGYARAYKLRSAGQARGSHGPETLEHQYRLFRCIAAEFGVVVREKNGALVPVTLKWACGVVDEGISRLAFFRVKQTLANMCERRRPGSPITMARGSCDWLLGIKPEDEA